MTERAVAASGVYSAVSTGTVAGVQFGGINVNIQNTIATGKEQPDQTWEHAVKWRDVVQLFRRIKDFDADQFCSYMEMNANSLEDFLEGSVVKTSGGIVQGNLLVRNIGCKVYKGKVFAIPNNDLTAASVVPFNSTAVADVEEFDSNAFHSLTTNSTRITIPADLGGKYLLTGGVSFAANGVGLRWAGIDVTAASGNVTYWQMSTNSGAIFGTSLIATAVHDLAAGDYVELRGYQNSGGALNTSATRTTFLSAVYLGT